jgi:hypothetical protein
MSRCRRRFWAWTLTSSKKSSGMTSTSMADRPRRSATGCPHTPTLTSTSALSLTASTTRRTTAISSTNIPRGRSRGGVVRRTPPAGRGGGMRESIVAFRSAKGDITLTPAHVTYKAGNLNHTTTGTASRFPGSVRSRDPPRCDHQLFNCMYLFDIWVAKRPCLYRFAAPPGTLRCRLAELRRAASRACATPAPLA